MHFKVGRDPVRNLWKFSTIISEWSEGGLAQNPSIDGSYRFRMQGGGFCDNLC